MKEYKFVAEEVLRRTFYVEAESEEEARAIAEDEYYSGAISVDEVCDAYLYLENDRGELV